MKVSVLNNHKGYANFDKEEKTMIRTERCRNYGQLEDQARGNADIEEFVFRNGEVVPAKQVKNSDTPVINTAPEKNFAR